MTTKIDKSVPTVGVVSLGCSKNRVNTEQMMYLLRQAGYFVTGETDSVDAVLLNTCGFIESAKSEAFEFIHEFIAAKKESRIGKLVVAGCLPERYKNEIIRELPEIDAVVGTGSFDDIVDVFKALQKGMPDQARHDGLQQPLERFGDINAPVSETGRIISTSPVWAYLKIAEGCDNHCAYCCIPAIRGRYRSRPVEKIVEEAKKLVGSGIQELIIVAQDVTRYKRLPELLSALDRIDGLKWIRLHYMYPDGFTDELIDVIAKSDKILKYLDIPIQHINNGILKKMNRRGTKEDITKLFKRLRESIPGVVLRTSLITGLPGEGIDEFNELCDFIREMKIERIGVFAYSPEDGTPAASMERPSKKTAEKRADKLLDLQSQIMFNWNKSRIGSVVTVLMEDDQYARSFAESPDIDGVILVKTKKGESVRFSKCLVSEAMDVRITGIENGQLAGEIY